MNARSFISVFILFFINLINYMDRFTVAGVLQQIGDYYDFDQTSKGLIQTYFIVSYMIFAPLFGYWGDRYNRKYIMAFGVLFWSATTFLGSFVPATHSYLFFVFRGLVGIGEASYSTLAPTIIADLYTKEMRTKMLALFYFAIPVGSGLGYIVAVEVANLFGSWHYALRVTPLMGVLSVIALLIFLKEPERGQSEQAIDTEQTKVWDDVCYLTTVKSYVWSTIGFTCVCFSIGALSWWGPSFVMNAAKSRSDDNNPDERQINTIFGGITVFGGIFGVVAGTMLSNYYRRITQRADPLICGFSVLAAVPFSYLAILLARSSPLSTWIFISIGITLLCLNWCLVADMLLYLVVPNKRSFAQSIQILVSHLLGDALSPYIVGKLFDWICNGSDTPIALFVSLQYSLYVNCFVLVFGGLAFLYTAVFIVEDVERCKQRTQGINYSASNTCIDSVVSDSDPCIPKQDSSVNLSTSNVYVESDTRRLVSID